jgi:DNA polymerase III psi subunit
VADDNLSDDPPAIKSVFRSRDLDLDHLIRIANAVGIVLACSGGASSWRVNCSVPSAGKP